MSNQLSIQPGQAVLGSDPSAGSTPPAKAQIQPQAAKPVPMFLNPSFQFDPTVGLTVISFCNNTGQVTNSIPSQSQLKAYRDHQEAVPGEQAPPVPKPLLMANDKTAAG